MTKCVSHSSIDRLPFQEDVDGVPAVLLPHRMSPPLAIAFETDMMHEATVNFCGIGPRG
jgi:hypothetical protein